MKTLIIILAIFLYGVNADAKGSNNDCCDNNLTYAECVIKCGTSECCDLKAGGVQNSDCCDSGLSKEECADKCGTSECCGTKAGGVQTSDCCDSGLSKEECADKCGTSECCKKGTSSGKTDDDLKCVVSGEVIEGKPISYTYLGKEYNFCCGGCLSAFKHTPIKYVSEGLVCPVMGNPAKENVTTEIDGVTYYFCCPPCIDKFTENFEQYSSGFTQKEKVESSEDHKH